MRQTIQGEFDVKLGPLVGAEIFVEAETDVILIDFMDTSFKPGAIGYTAMSRIPSDSFLW